MSLQKSFSKKEPQKKILYYYRARDEHICGKDDMLENHATLWPKAVGLIIPWIYYISPYFLHFYWVR